MHMKQSNLKIIAPFSSDHNMKKKGTLTHIENHACKIYFLNKSGIHRGISTKLIQNRRTINAMMINTS